MATIRPTGSLPVCCKSVRFAAGLFWLIGGALIAEEMPVGLQHDVIFTESLPLAERLPINLADERFVLYVPQRPPAAGYGILVFVPPWQQAKLPSGWKEPLDQAGMIYVSAAHSGNVEPTPARRQPLALLAAYNVARRYKVDPTRIYVGGFSGGSKVALRLALSFPSVFVGALLNAGSDPIGDDIAQPTADQQAYLRRNKGFVFVTGENDAINLAADQESIRSLMPFCVRLDSQIMPWKGHAVMDGSALTEALAALDHPKDADCAP